MKKEFKDVQIVGAVLISRVGHIAHYTIKSLLKHCSKVIIVLDNSDTETEKIVRHYEKYREITVIESPYIGTTAEEEDKDPLCMYYRFKEMQGEIRQLVFDELKKRHDAGEQIDILVWPDQDEIFGVEFPKLLKKFWESNYKAICCKAVDLFGDFTTIHDCGMTCHIRILKFSTEFTSNPYRWGCRYLPLKREDCMGDRFNLIHLSLLGKGMIEWRRKHWNRRGHKMNMDMKLWCLPKDVREMIPKEIQAVYRRTSDMTVEEYLRGGDKRKPVGIENAANALREATDMLDKKGVRYFLAFGSALFLYRNKELGREDWDVDLICLAEDLDKINQREIEAHGFTNFKRKRDIPKWIDKDGNRSEELYVRTISFEKFGVRVDVDPAYISKDGKDRLIIKGRKREMFVALHPASFFENCEEIEYRGKKYKIPTPIDEYLVSNYGKDWRTPVYGATPWSERSCRRDEYYCE